MKNENIDLNTCVNVFCSEKGTIFKLFHTYCNEAPVFAVIENKKIDLAELKEIEDFFGYMQLKFGFCRIKKFKTSFSTGIIH